MQVTRPFSQSFVMLGLLVLTVPAAAQGGTPFYLKSSNLDCSDASQGQPVACGVNSVPPNAGLTFEWSDDVDLSTVSLFSFQVLDFVQGISVPGQFTLKDARTIQFMPLFGFADNVPYIVTVPGTAQGGAGPFLLSAAGAPNLSTLTHVFLGSSSASNVLSECQTTPNSVGPGAVVSWCGSSSLGLSDLELTVSGLPLNRFAVPLAGNSTATLPFGDGVLCLGSPFARLRPLSTGNGKVDYVVDWTGLPAQLGVAAGTSVRFQLLYRDSAGGPAGFNLSDAVVADLVP